MRSFELKYFSQAVELLRALHLLFPYLNYFFPPSTYREIQDEDIGVISHVLVQGHHQHHQDVPDGPDDDDEREEDGHQVGN